MQARYFCLNVRFTKAAYSIYGGKGIKINSINAPLVVKYY